MKNLDFNKIMIVNFAVEERTVELSNYCFERLGFKNVITLQGTDGFRDKFLNFAKIAVESDCDCFIRTDADRLVFDGIFDLILKYYQNNDAMCVEGLCFDYFMNKLRGATPHVFSRSILEMLDNDNELMPNSQKPESHFVAKVAPTDSKKFLSVKTLTNLHEYEQYPSKVCNAYLNRIYRGHKGYYDESHLKSLPEVYQNAINQAKYFALKHESKNTMDHIDFKFLDEGFHKISSDQIESLYEHYLNLYKHINKGLENKKG